MPADPLDTAVERVKAWIAHHEEQAEVFAGVPDAAGPHRQQAADLRALLELIDHLRSEEQHWRLHHNIKEELLREAQAAAALDAQSPTCPHVQTGDEGTSFCRLAEAAARPAPPEPEPGDPEPVCGSRDPHPKHWWMADGKHQVLCSGAPAPVPEPGEKARKMLDAEETKRAAGGSSRPRCLDCGGLCDRHFGVPLGIGPDGEPDAPAPVQEERREEDVARVADALCLAGRATWDHLARIAITALSSPPAAPGGGPDPAYLLNLAAGFADDSAIGTALREAADALALAARSAAPGEQCEPVGAEYPPSLTDTFRWADGEEMGDFAWMASDDDFEMWDGDEPKAYLQETWQRTGLKVHWAMPDLYDCDYEDAEPCEEDAVAWQREGDTWMAACENHRSPARRLPAPETPEGGKP